MVSVIATIPKKVSGGDDLVVIRREDFEAFQKWQVEVDDALAKIERGRTEYRRGKAVRASSPRKFR
ncbi:hypothetical protein HYW59_01815 [Candidatus Kaiserbacteria bacterium]|nr:hypothetical protein [Candidatus Kaiserbacteria bacterium]